ncbi:MULTISPECIES: cytochrome ubiquinol oxidase subunit I [unclassified Nocardiopsis]|uniref:cytochrome ubiquinol oxidase subunit I n=1 Tax=Nocardiopsis TaxID=2013 RepID=UPI00387AF0CF
MLDLARLQFAVTTNLHFVFVALTLGLVPMVAVMQTRHTFTGRGSDERLTRFWGQIYLINYALGIVTGLVLEFQFGMSWSGLSHFAGDVFGAPLALETMTAFFLESTFLGLWIFGWHILPKRVHLALIWLVALTAYVSALWILAANSYLQNPVGSRVVDGRLVLDDFGLFITNPHMLTALPHVTGAAFMTASWLVIGVSAHHLRRGDHVEFFTSCLRWGVLVAAGGGLLTFISGHVAPAYVEATQPDKLEGPMEPFLNSMLLIGDVLTALTLLVLLPMLFRNRLARARRFLPVLIVLAPLPVAASALGWIVREMGRQPWLVYEHLTVAEGLSPGVSAPVVATSLVVFTLVLGSLAVTNVVLILRSAARGPDDVLLGSKPVEPPPPSPAPISGENV